MVRVLVWACIVLVAEVAAAQSQPGGVRTVYLIRHGAYVADRNADPQLGPGLTPLGIAQARLVAARLNGSGVSFDSMTVESSAACTRYGGGDARDAVESAAHAVSAAQGMHAHAA